jgi:hypothetical protein
MPALTVEKRIIRRVVEYDPPSLFVSQRVELIKIGSEHSHLNGRLVNIDVEPCWAAYLMIDSIASPKSQQSSIMKSLRSKEIVGLLAQTRLKAFELAGVFLSVSLALLQCALMVRRLTTVVAPPKFFREIFHGYSTE